MPEGHTIHRLARLLNGSLAGKPVRASSPQGRFAEGAERLDGLTLRGADAWGKYLFCNFDSGDILHFHLGLIGKFRARKAPIPDPVGAVRLRMFAIVFKRSSRIPPKVKIFPPLLGLDQKPLYANSAAILLYLKPPKIEHIQPQKLGQPSLYRSFRFARARCEKCGPYSLVAYS